MQLKIWRGYAMLALFLFLLACHAYVFPRWADPNQNSRLDMVVAVVEDGTFQIDNYVANTVDYAKVGDHYYSDKAPGAALLGIPIYALLKSVLDSPLAVRFADRIGQSAAFQTTLRAEGTGVNVDKVKFAIAQVVLALVTNALPTALLGVMLFQSLSYFAISAPIRLLVAISYNLLTPAFAYANAFYGHQLSAALLFAAFFLTLRYQNNLKAPHLLLIGLFLGYSVVTEYPTILIVGILFLYTFYTLLQAGHGWRIVYVILTGGIIALGWMFYNTLIFGGPLSLGYSHSELWTAQHETGFMSLTMPHWEALLGITFSPYRGLFVLAPWLLFALPGFYFWWRTNQARTAWWTTLAAIIATALFNASSGMWWGGFAVGPRYFLPALPFLALGAAFAFEHWQHSLWWRGLTTLTLLISFIFGWGLTLAEQAFPPDYLYNPLVEYALPNWQQGNIARNLGTIAGLQGVWSLMPLLVFIVIGTVLLFTLIRTSQPNTRAQDFNRKLTLAGAAQPLLHRSDH